MNRDQHPPAFVVGACAHGLAIIRALGRAGVDVHIVESNPSLPGLQTRFGTKHVVADINGASLVPSLLELRAQHSPSVRPVLFLTNDRMVQAVAANVDSIAGRFALSWSESASAVDRFTRKTEIEVRCRSIGLNYPDTAVLHHEEELPNVLRGLTWPRIIKPARPLSSFKVQYVEAEGEAASFLRAHSADFPVLLQRWIPGDDTALFFTAFYLERGVPLARFDGRKLRSYPMGHTTVAEPTHNDAVFEYAAAFFEGTDISGPASLEVKVTPTGERWVIEPTVGRTDFWLDLCISNGVNLPLIEYRHQSKLPLTRPQQLDRKVWINGVRDPRAPAWYFANLKKASKSTRRVRFAYVDAWDPAPAINGLGELLARIVASARARWSRWFARRFSAV